MNIKVYLTDDEAEDEINAILEPALSKCLTVVLDPIVGTENNAELKVLLIDAVASISAKFVDLKASLIEHRIALVCRKVNDLRDGMADQDYTMSSNLFPKKG